MGFFKSIGDAFTKPAGILGGLLKDVPGVGPAFSAFAEQQAATDQNSAAQLQSREQMQFSAAQAQKQMDFQERMSSSAHQREVSDLKAAGLNPLLSVNSGASSPSGAAGSSAGYSPVGLPAGRYLASANEARVAKQTADLMKHQIRNAEVQTRVTEEQGENLFENRRGARLENDLLSLRNDFFKKHPNVFKLQAAAGGINSASSILRLLK